MSFEEQIMSKNKNPSILSKLNGGYCVCYLSNIFRSTRSFQNWGIHLGYIRSHDAFRPITRERTYLMACNTGQRLNLFSKLSIEKPRVTKI